MTSCMMPVQLPTSSSLLLKRVRSASPSPTPRSASPANAADTETKVCKRQLGSSPRSAAAASAVAVTILSSRQRPSLSPIGIEKPVTTTTTTTAAAWPVVKSCDGVRNALTFLQTSRQHAMMLMLQNHWDRAVGVLEKIEKATESVCAQRRKVVIEQANAQLPRLAAKIDDLGLSDVASAPVRRQRSVRFSDCVSVAVAVDMDRASAAAPSVVREEMFVLRASRTIPRENYSEFW